MRLARAFGRFLDLLFPPADTARIVHDATDDAFYALVSPRKNDRGVVTLLPYRHRLIRAVVIEAKFRKNRRAIRLLANALREYLDARDEESAPFSSEGVVIVPIPLSRERYRARGYNQIEEVAAAAELSCAPVLERVRDTKPQTSLARRERLSNMENSFRAVGPVESSATYIVLDDVTTTGATLEAAANALRAAGAKRIELLALAH